MARTSKHLARFALLTAVLLAVIGLVVTLARPAPELSPTAVTDGVAAATDRAPRVDASVELRHSAAPVTMRGCWSADVGARFDYRLRDRLDVTIHSAEGGTQSGGALRSECLVTTTVLDRRPDEVLVRHQISGLQLLGADNRPIEKDPIQRSFVAAVAEPVFVRLGAEGGIRGYAFADGLDGDQRNFLRGTLGLLACEAPAGGAMQWAVTGDDTTGSFEASYQRIESDADEVAIARTQKRYTAIVGCDQLPAHTVTGAAQIRFATELGWLRSVHLDESMTMALPMLDLQTISQRTAQVDLIDAGTTAVEVDVAAIWAAATAPASGRGEQLGAYAAAQERDRWLQLLKGVTVDQLLAELRQVLAGEPVDHEALNDLFTRLQWLAKLDDRAAQALGEMVAQNQLAEESARVALGALGAAGTRPAQQVLAAVRADHNASAPLREAATFACLQLGEPSAEILNGLALEAMSSSDLHGSSMLVLGALLPRSGEPLADGRQPLQALLEMEAAAAARGELDTWLLAVGNTGSDEALPIALRLLGHVEAKVRGAACVVLRSIAAESALTALVQRGLTDQEPSVRYEAVLALGRRTEAAARAALQQVAKGDPDQAVRARAERLLNPPS